MVGDVERVNGSEAAIRSSQRQGLLTLIGLPIPMVWTPPDGIDVPEWRC